jgi:hypothetical protein
VHSRTVRVELPVIRYATMPSMELMNGRTLPMELMEMARTTPETSAVLTEAARLLEALRFGLMSSDEQEPYDRSLMSEGEIAIAKGQRIISNKLDAIIALMEKREARENPQAAANHPSWPRPEVSPKG